MKQLFLSETFSIFMFFVPPICKGGNSLENIIKILFCFVGMIIMLMLYKYRTERFSFLKDEEIKDYPIKMYKVGGYIIIFWMIIILLVIFQEVILKKTIDFKIFLIPFLISVIYGLFGAIPIVIKSKYLINLSLDFITIGKMGVDLLGSWIGTYDNGLIVYFYLIDYNSIKIIKNSPNKIVFSGIAKYENTPILVNLNSKISVSYFEPILKGFMKSQ